MTALNQVKSMMIQLTREGIGVNYWMQKYSRTESDPFKQIESLRKEYSLTAQVNAEGK